MTIAIVVHGGAGLISPDRADAVQAGCRAATRLGWDILRNGGSALDAVEAAVRALENDPNYNAGTGAVLTTEGTIELDAGIMEGRNLNAGAIADVQFIKNPVSLARKVLESPHVLLVGKGAQVFAHEQGIAPCKFEDLLTERQYRRWQERHQVRVHDDAGEPRYHRQEVGSTTARVEDSEEKHGTVGAVALDQSGLLVAAASTGGIPYKYPGRVGDSPLVGCGFYADENAAISCTGQGEDFIRLLIARRAAEFVARGDSARAAAEAAIAVLGAKATGTGGLIIVDRLGNAGFAWNSQHMVYAYMAETTPEPVAGI
ncbi:MAG: isoaspartyl peptidase/L-asparaginase family protein [Ktedonobacteraceae bacterium]|nr:isoaspartyl peptidase/L-asparaginase [Chloroflexota bacterium]